MANILQEVTLMLEKKLDINITCFEKYDLSVFIEKLLRDRVEVMDEILNKQKH